MKDGFRELITIQDAWKVLTDHISLMPTEKIDVRDALERILAQDLYSEVDIPHFERSAMDGYAVKAEDTFGCSQTSPAGLKIVDRINIYESSSKLVDTGTTVKVATGSPIPAGADAVVKVEEAEEKGDFLEIHFPTVPGKHVMKLGEDVKKGDLLLKAGMGMRPQDLTILIGCGIPTVPVRERPKVAIIATGSELVEIGQVPKIGEIVETNTHLIDAHAKLYGGVPSRVGIIEDDEEKLTKALHASLNTADVVIFSGGTSVGERDFLPDIIRKEGKLLFHGVAMRPGSPIAVGKVEEKLVFCLPGFPVSTMVAFEVFSGPTLRKMQGARILDPRPKIKAKLLNAIPSRLGRRDFVRVSISKEKGIFYARNVRIKGAGIISSTTKADGILEVPENVEGLEKDTEVQVSLYLPLSIQF